MLVLPRDSEYEIGAIIVYGIQAQAQKLAVVGHAKLRVIDTIRGLTIIRCQVVNAVFHELDRMPGDLRQCASDSDRFANHMLATEAAAGVHGMEVHHVGWQLQRARNKPPYIVEHIGVRPDLHATAACVVLADRSGWLHGCSRSARPAQAAFNDLICTGEVPIHIAKSEDMLEDDVRREILMHLWRIRLHGFQHIDHGWQWLTLHLYQFQGILSNIATLGSHGYHCLTGIAHLLYGNRVLDDRLGAKGWHRTNHLGRLTTCQYSIDAGQLLRSAGVYADNASMCIRTA